jgi:hypothetical protein
MTAAARKPAAEIPPATPGPGAELWRCRVCHPPLGLIEGRRVYIKLKERSGRTRRIVSALPCRQVCGNCGAVNVRA